MSTEATIRTLLDEHGTTFAAQAGIRLADKPLPLFRLLVLTSLLSANIDPQLGLRTARALADAGLTTPTRLRDAGEDAVWQVLSDSKYLRKRQTARQLIQLADEALDRWSGDLRRLCDQSDDPRDAIKDFTGIGPLGADIFCREVQTVWPSLQPYADKRVLKLARKQGLPRDATKLAEAAGTTDLSQLGAALLSADMTDRGSLQHDKRGKAMAANKGSDTVKKANAKAAKEGKRNPRKSSKAQAELGKKGAKAKKSKKK